MFYYQKVVVSGPVIELYEYDRIQKRGYTLRKRPAFKGQLKLNFEPKTKRMDNINRTRTFLRRLINSNPDLDKFITLTFKENISDITLANRLFAKFIMKLKYRYPDIRYIAVIEFQRRGAVHYHVLMKLPYIEANYLAYIWSHGFVKINEINHVDNVGAYICKYLSKDTTDERMWGKKKFFCSKNLNTPEEFFTKKEVDIIKSAFDLVSVEPVYNLHFDNEWTGGVKYNQYNLNRPERNDPEKSSSKGVSHI